ncbi:MAG: BrnT family toxin [Bdellovibrionota bacterium]|mgnify:CR=1 FL=1
MTITWNERKAKVNEAKHGVSFDEAATVLISETALVFEDDSSEEERFKAIGFSAAANLLLVVYHYRDDATIRIISARRATANERREYEKRV